MAIPSVVLRSRAQSRGLEKCPKIAKKFVLGPTRSLRPSLESNSSPFFVDLPTTIFPNNSGHIGALFRPFSNHVENFDPGDAPSTIHHSEIVFRRRAAGR